jgi:Domain of unknown function (DUF4384)
LRPISWCLLAASSWVSCALAQQVTGKLTARELFYSATEPASSPKPAKPAAKPKPPRHKAPAAADPVETGGNQTTTSSPGSDSAPVINAAYKPHGSHPALGLRYTMLKKTGDEAVEVDAEAVFHAGDRIRIAVEANDDGYLYVVNQGSSGTWKLLFPSPEIKNGDNHVQKRVRYEIPSGYTFTFDEQAGAEKLFIVLSRQPEPDLESLIYSLGHGAQDKAADKPKVMMASAAFSDDVIGRLRTAYARDLIVEKVDDEQPGPKREKAVYAVNPSGSADSRVVADVTLKHQ